MAKALRRRAFAILGGIFGVFSADAMKTLSETFTRAPGPAGPRDSWKWQLGLQTPSKDPFLNAAVLLAYS